MPLELIIIGGIVITGIALSAAAAMKLYTEANLLAQQQAQQQAPNTINTTPTPVLSPLVTANPIISSPLYNPEAQANGYFVAPTTYTSLSKIPQMFYMTTSPTLMNTVAQPTMGNNALISNEQLIAMMFATISTTAIGTLLSKQGSGMVQPQQSPASPATSQNTDECCSTINFNIGGGADQAATGAANRIIGQLKDNLMWVLKYVAPIAFVARMLSLRITMIPARNEWSQADYNRWENGVNGAWGMDESDKSHLAQ